MKVIPGLPPELKRLATVYEFIPPEQFARLGIDPEDVPLGSFPAHNHPPFLPNRFGGNAYGLGLFESSTLDPKEAQMLESLDFSDTRQMGEHCSRINDIFKKLGLLIRFTSYGLPFYLIPRRHVIHFSTEIQAKAGWIEQFLQPLDDRDAAGVGIIANQAGLLLGELQTRLPRLNFLHLDSLEAVRSQPAPLQAVIMLNSPMEIDFLSSAHQKNDLDSQYNTGCFAAGQIHDLLAERGRLLIVCDSPDLGQDQLVKVQFHGQEEYKRFLLFSHRYKTRQRYNSRQGLHMSVHSADFYTFLTAHGLYYENMESMLGGIPLPQVSPPEIDSLPYHDAPLPLAPGGVSEQQAYWHTCFAPYFSMNSLDSVLPAPQENFWNEKYSITASWPRTLLVGDGRRKEIPVRLRALEDDSKLKFLIGCPRQLLAPYKNTFAYVLKTLEVVRQIYEERYPGLTPRGQRMLLGAFESDNLMVQDAKRLLERIDDLRRMEQRINPLSTLGAETPMLENLEKLGLLGLERGVLGQIYLTVMGHSSLGRVCLGKLSEQTLAPLADVHNYSSLEEAISTINLCRLFSYAETASSAYIAKHSNLMAEIFAMSLTTTRVVTDPYTNWEDIEKERVLSAGGLKNLVVDKLLKLLNLFDFLGNWGRLVEAGPYQREVLTNFDYGMQEKADQVLSLHNHVLQFLETFYVNDPHSQPYFFQALLDCHVHGVSRLLPRLGAKAALNLLWMCVHVSDVRVFNLNLLPHPHNPEQLNHFNKLRQNLENMPLAVLAPAALNDLRQGIKRQKAVYVQDTGIYFTLDEENGVLAPGFLDPQQALHELKWEMRQAEGQPLEQCAPSHLKLLDQTYNSLRRYFKNTPENGWEFEEIEHKFFHHIIGQLLDLPHFAERLQHLYLHCPHLLREFFAKPAEEKQDLPLRAALKLDAILQYRLESFQNMQSSYEAAVVEFGASATGIVGVSKLQFAYLGQQLQTILANYPSLHNAMIISILLAARDEAHHNLEFILHRDILPDERMQGSLRFLLAAQHLPWLVISGQAPVNHLAVLLDVEERELLSSVFILSIIYIACREEGFLSEDMLERMLIFWRRLEIWRKEHYDARLAQREMLERHNALRQIFDKYLAEKNGLLVLPNLEEIAINQAGAETPGREIYRQMAMDRLLRLCGFYLVEAIDVHMFLRDIPVAFIYRNKRLHSCGLASFSRELEEAAGLGRELDNPLAAFILDSLSDFDRPVLISRFTGVAQKLEPSLRLKLLGLGLRAAQQALREPGKTIEVNYRDLNNLDSSRFNLLNHVLLNLEIAQLTDSAAAGLNRLAAGILITVNDNQISLSLADVARLSQIIESFERAGSIEHLDCLYHQEVERLAAWTEEADSFRGHLDSAYQAHLNRLADIFLDQARIAMHTARDMKALVDLLAKYRKQALAMPERRLAMLDDLYAFNAERIQTGLLQYTSRRLAGIESLSELDALWRKTIPKLAQSGVNEQQDSSLNFSMAAFFDRRARELAG